jgi:hypothetical protein
VLPATAGACQVMGQGLESKNLLPKRKKQKTFARYEGFKFLVIKSRNAGGTT